MQKLEDAQKMVYEWLKDADEEQRSAFRDVVVLESLILELRETLGKLKSFELIKKNTSDLSKNEVGKMRTYEIRIQLLVTEIALTKNRIYERKISSKYRQAFSLAEGLHRSLYEANFNKVLDEKEDLTDEEAHLLATNRALNDIEFGSYGVDSLKKIEI